MSARCKHHRSRLRASATAAVVSAEEACLAHIQSQGELSPIDSTLQEKVSKAAYAAAAVDGFTAQVQRRHPEGRRAIVGLAVDIAVDLTGH